MSWSTVKIKNQDVFLKAGALDQTCTFFLIQGFRLGAKIIKHICILYILKFTSVQKETCRKTVVYAIMYSKCTISI